MFGYIQYYSRSNIKAYEWMAPEIMDDTIPKYSTKSDIFSFGVILWELLTGKHPFKGDKPPEGIQTFIKSGNRLPLNKDWDPTLYNIIESCWNADPNARPPVSEIVTLIEKRLSMDVKESSSIWKFTNFLFPKEKELVKTEIKPIEIKVNTESSKTTIIPDKNGIEEELIIKCLDTGEKFAINDVDVKEGLSNKPIAAVFIAIKPTAETEESTEKQEETKTKESEESKEKNNENDKEIQEKEELEEITL